MKDIDIRIMKLNKWYVPKTQVLNGNIESQNKQVVLGYFDDVEIVGTQENNGEKEKEQIHPFLQGYNQMIALKSREKSVLVDYSSQEQMIFTNIRNKEEGEKAGFSKREIEQFWKDKSWPYLFITMIHIPHSGKLKEALKKVDDVFQENYLSYITFDYCDIIIFTKRIYIKKYLDNIKKLFYTTDAEEKSLFFDTFSMVSFNESYLGKIEDDMPKSEEDEFQATINLSIRNYEGFEQFCKDLDASKLLYNMYGRYDVSIIKEAADTKWLLNAMKILHKKEYQKFFWTFETCIKTKDDIKERIVVGEDHKTEKIYEYIKKSLNEDVNELRQVVEESDLENKYNFILPVCEVRDCICSIIKNSFAEELIYCIYEPFRAFIKYMTKTIGNYNKGISDTDISEKKIAESYDNYFTALTALVNSTMHSDRQFIQSTTFNAIFYSVPPKIMSFYNAYIYKLKEILKDEEQKENISYLIYPSFLPEVAVEKISLNDKPPCERVLKIKVNEKALYDMGLIIMELVHELAHNLGTRVRCREARAKSMYHTLIGFIRDQYEIEDENIISAVEDFIQTKWLKKKKELYLEDFSEDSVQFYEYLIGGCEKKIPKILRKKYKKSMKEDIPNNGILAEVGLADKNLQKQYRKYYLMQYCKEIGQDIKKKIVGIEKGRYEELTNLLYQIYYECYADLQMILVLGISLEDYINIFLKKENISVKELLGNDEDTIRISTVCRVMQDCGLWEEYRSEGEQKDVLESIVLNNEILFAEIKENNVEILNEIGEMAKKYIGDKKLFQTNLLGDFQADFVNIQNEKLERNIYILNDLYVYLLAVVRAVLEEYNVPCKRKKIEQIQGTVKKILESKDITLIFDCIEKELEKYGEVLFNI